MFVQRDFCSFRNFWEISSDSEAFTEDGSRGASPPFGEAIVRETLSWRTSWGWANSGFGILLLVWGLFWNWVVLFKS